MYLDFAESISSFVGKGGWGDGVTELQNKQQTN